MSDETLMNDMPAEQAAEAAVPDETTSAENASVEETAEQQPGKGDSEVPGPESDDQPSEEKPYIKIV